MFVDEKSAGEPQTAEQANRKLKLSAAIRAGADLFPRKCKLAYFDGEDGACALGGAFYVMYFNRDDIPAIDEEKATMERMFGAPHRILKSIAEKNDTGWDRKRIADWLERKGY